MSNEDLNGKTNEKMPDETDEKFWQNFSRDLWLMFRKAEPTPETEGVPADEPQNTDDSIDNEKPLNLRENCLTFTRCGEIGQRRSAVSGAEKTHLENCRFCARRVEKFGLTSPAAVLKRVAATGENAVSPILTIAPTPKENFWKWFFPAFGGRSKPPFLIPAFGLAGLALIFFGGLALIVFRTEDNQSKTSVADLKSAPDVISPPPKIADSPRNENFNAGKLTPTNSRANDSPPIPKKSPTAAAEKPPDQRISDESAINFGAVAGSERAAVRESLATGKILPSADLARLQNVPVRRAGESIFALPVSPKNEATLAAAPVFRWQTKEKVECQIIVTDDAGREVAKSAVLSQNNWQIEKELPAGFYFWKIAARRKGIGVFTENSSQAMFKILSAGEKRELETAKNSVKSNLVNAILYARAGLLAEAERELNIELRKNPNSLRARKMLAQVKNWREK